MTQFNLDLINKWPTFGWPLSSTSIAALSVYAVGGFDPKLALDFKNGVYKVNGSDSTLANSVTHVRAGHATMVDSDGLIKWAPHNLLAYSQDFSSWPTSSNVTITSNTTIAPDGTTTADSAIFDGNDNARVEQSITQTGSRVLAVWMKVPSGTQGVYIGFTSGDLSLVTVTDQWVLYSYESANGTYPRINCRDIATVHIWGARVYRSDLVGMVNNPATGDSYVPTTSSPVYLPRVGHHVYNGSAWVNEGILHESEARTNSMPQSTDMLNWRQLNITASSSTVTSPSGNQDAILIKPNSASLAKTFFYDRTQLGNLGAPASASFYAKASGKDFISLSNSNGSGAYGSFNLATGVATDFFNGYTATMEDCGNGWYRCCVVYTGNWHAYVVFAITDVLPVFGSYLETTANGNDGVLLYAPQLEANTTPSSYIPTTSSTVTRAADTLTVPAANLPYSSTNMSIQMDGKMTYADNGIFPTTQGVFGEVSFFFWQLGVGEFISTGINTGSARLGQYEAAQRSSTSGGVQITQGGNSDYSPDINVPFNTSSIHSPTFIKGATEGTLTTSAYPSRQGLPDLSSTDLLLANTFMGTIGKFRVWDEDLTDTGIATASAPSTEPSLQLTFDGSSTSSFTVLDWSE